MVRIDLRPSEAEALKDILRSYIHDPRDEETDTVRVALALLAELVALTDDDS